LVPGLASGRAAPWIAIALGLILAAALRGPAAHSPIFDGLPLPQPPYRYCSPPANLGSSNQPPLTGQGSLPLENGQLGGGTVRTADGQLTVSIGRDGLKASPDAARVTVRLDPVCDLVAPPPGAIILGNVYRIAAVEEPSGAPVVVARAYALILVYPPGPLGELEIYDGASWRPLPTRHSSFNSAASADLTMLGEVAAVAPVGGETILGLLTRLLQTYGFLAFITVLVAFGVVGEMRSRLRKRKQSRSGL